MSEERNEEQPPHDASGNDAIAEATGTAGGTEHVASAPREDAPHTEINIDAAASDAEVEAQMRRLSRRSFLWGAVAVGTGFGGWRWLVTRRPDDGIPWPFRRALQFNEELGRDFFKTTRLAPTFAPAQAAAIPRVNGAIGMEDEFDPKEWRLNVEGLADEEAPEKELTLAHIKSLPRVEMVTELKCIEGWSMIVRWGGARLSDFIAKYPPATRSGDAPDVRRKPEDLPGFVGMATPDGGYYVGLDMESALHPQTLLCYEMNGKPLTPEHGAPLRLAIPVKYGTKSIKRIGVIRFSDRRPADYWAEQGYDYYSGH